jgi:hypothetical protein
MSLIIDDKATEERAARLAEIMGQSPQNAVSEALRVALEQTPETTGPVAADHCSFDEAVRRAQDALAKLPVVDPHFKMDDLYDENGLSA